MNLNLFFILQRLQIRQDASFHFQEREKERERERERKRERKKERKRERKKERTLRWLK